MIGDHFDRPLPMESHPVWQQHYILPTPQIDRAVRHCAKCLKHYVPGSIIYSRTRYGKSYFIKFLVYFLRGLYPKLVAIVIDGQVHRMPSEGSFFSLLLEGARHDDPIRGTPAAKRRRLLQKLLTLAQDSGQKFIVFIADEAQKFEVEEYEWLWEVHDALERQGFRMITFLVGQPKLLNRKSALKQAGEMQIVARFMLEEMQFHGVRSAAEAASCLAGFDTTMYPSGSDWSLTRFFFPKAWSRGFRLGQYGGPVWDEFQRVHTDEVKLSEPLEIPMTFFARALEYLLKESYVNDSFKFELGMKDFAEAIEFCRFGAFQDEILNKVVVDADDDGRSPLYH